MLNEGSPCLQKLGGRFCDSEALHKGVRCSLTSFQVVAWATSTGKVGELFDAVIDSIIGKV